MRGFAKGRLTSVLVTSPDTALVPPASSALSADATAHALPAADARPEATALVADGVSVSYGASDVVHDARLELRPGRVTALVGPNGSGKSTLLRTAARLQRARAGTLSLEQQPLQQAEASAAPTDGLALSVRDFARHVALLTQGRPVPSGLSVRDVVQFGRYPHRGRWGRTDPGGAAAVDRALQLTGVEGFAERGGDQLSGGQLQRVWLAS